MYPVVNVIYYDEDFNVLGNHYVIDNPPLRIPKDTVFIQWFYTVEPKPVPIPLV